MYKLSIEEVCFSCQLEYLGSGYDQLVFPKNELKPLVIDKFSRVCKEGLDFIRSMLAWGLSERISLSQALSHPYLADARARGKEERMKMIVQHLLALSSINSPTVNESGASGTPDTSKHPPTVSKVRVANSNDSLHAESCASDTSLGLHKLQVVNLVWLLFLFFRD